MSYQDRLNRLDQLKSELLKTQEALAFARNLPIDARSYKSAWKLLSQIESKLEKSYFKTEIYKLVIQYFKNSSKN